MNCQPYSLYVHVPFCSKRCPYCDFNTYVEEQIPEERYLDCLLNEIELHIHSERWRGRNLRSIYFGGGTPSLFDPDTIRQFISFASRNIGFCDDVEITLEANPGSVDTARLIAYKDAGINRLSFGVQSFHNRILKILGRDHSASDAVNAYTAARKAGFKNISCDLMFGIPQQKMHELEQDLATLIELQPEHVSIYGLTVEKGTPFFQRQASGQLVMPDEDLCADMLAKVRNTLKRAGYEHYEISNFCKAGFSSRHNSGYWCGDDYMGLGAGAHSYQKLLDTNGHYLSGRRWSNYALPAQYMKTLESKRFPLAWQEELSVPDAIFEFFFLGLRMLKGLDLDVFERRFGFSHTEVYPALVEVLCAGGLLEQEGNTLCLSDDGFMVADSVIGHFSELERTPEWLKKAAIPNPTPPEIIPRPANLAPIVDPTTP